MSTTAAVQKNDERMLGRTIWRVMPMVTLCMALSTIDRSNIGFANLTMARDLGMSQAVFALGSSLFYIGYILFEIPSGLAAHRYGSRLWTARIMASWGLCTLLLAWTNSATVFYLLRFLLGVAEAGLYPSMVYYISLWMPRAKHARCLGFLTIGSALGNTFGALISGPLLDLNGAGGLAGWQWIFLVTGLVPVAAVILVLLHMKDSPRQASFLTPSERERLATLVEQDTKKTETASTILSALLNLRVLAFGIAYAALLCALYGVIYWSPSIIQSFGVTGRVNGLLVAAPWVVDTILLLMIPRNLPRRTVLLALIAVCGMGVLTFALSAFATSVPLRYATLFVGIPCISLAISFFWTFPIRQFQGAQAAGAIASTSMIGNFGSFIGQNAMPAVAHWGGGVSAALWVPCVCLGALLIGSVVALMGGGIGLRSSTQSVSGLD